ncbi:MAG: VOC family protein [Mycobacterium leprae]
MITGVDLVTVVVRDQDAALQFFTDKLGFRLKTDFRMGPEGPRWISILPPTDRGPQLILFDPRGFMPPEAAEEMLGLIGKMPGLVLGADDCRKTVAELEAKGVKILRQPQEERHGIEAVFADVDGNAYVLVEPRPH